MKTKDKREILAKDIKELENLLKGARSELFNLKLEKTQNKLKNTRSVFLKRKEISLILTAIKQKEFKNAKNV